MSRSQFRRLSLCAALGALAIAAVAIAPSRAAEEPVIIPAPTLDANEATGIQTAVLAGGCFWGVQGVYQHTAGVLNAVSGYSGGSKMTANYTMIGTGTTGHAESVEIKYDPKKISYGKILQIFFSVVHDPTQLNRQGPDTGTQYRSAIFYHSLEQQQAAEALIAELNAQNLWGRPIVTEVAPATKFYVAEDYHQEYFARTGSSNPYCSVVIEPKVAKFRKHFVDRLKK